MTTSITAARSLAVGDVIAEDLLYDFSDEEFDENADWATVTRIVTLHEQTTISTVTLQTGYASTLVVPSDKEFAVR